MTFWATTYPYKDHYEGRLIPTTDEFYFGSYGFTFVSYVQVIEFENPSDNWTIAIRMN